MRLHVALHAGDGERARRLHHAARVVEDVLDRGADLVVRHADDLVDDLLAEREGVRADGADGDAVGEDADLIERDAPAGAQRLVHGVGVERLDADDAHLRHHRLDVAADAGDQPAAADRHEHGVQLAALAMTHDLVADGALAGDDQRIVEGMDEGEAGLGDEPIAVRLRVRVAVAGEHHLGAARPHRLHLDRRRRLRHDDDGAQAELLRRIGDALGVVAGARGDHAARALVGGQVARCGCRRRAA